MFSWEDEAVKRKIQYPEDKENCFISKTQGVYYFFKSESNSSNKFCVELG